MRLEVPKKLIVIVLIIDLGVGGWIFYINSQNPVLPLDGELCEQGTSFNFTGYRYSSFPIDYNYHSTLPERFKDGVERAFDEWNSIVQGSIFVKSNLENPTLSINYGDTTYEGGVALALTHSFPFAFGNSIERSTVTFSDLYSFRDIAFSCNLLPITYEGPFDIMSVMVHELGHVLGLDHTDNEFTSLHTYYTGTFAQTLSEGDKDGFFRLYSPHFEESIL